MLMEVAAIILIIMMMVEVEIMRLAVVGWLDGWLTVIVWLVSWLVDWLAHMSKSGRSLVRRSSYFRMNWDLVIGQWSMVITIFIH